MEKKNLCILILSTGKQEKSIWCLALPGVIQDIVEGTCWVTRAELVT